MEIVELKVQVNRGEFDALKADIKKLRSKTVKISVDASGFNALNKATMQNIRDVTSFANATTKAKNATTDFARAQKQVADSSTKAATATKQVGTAAAQASKSTKLLGDSIGSIAAKMSGWQIMGELVSKPIAAFKEAVQTLKEVDSELVNIQKVTGSTDAEMAKLTDRAYQMASAYGRTATEVLSASTEFARAGYGDQIESLSEMSILLQNVGDVSSETANKFLLSVDAAWKLGGSEKELMAVMDGLNEITNRNATDMDKLASGMTVAATYFAESGESIQTFSALLGAGTAITQRSGTEIGRALKAIIMNIRQIRGETEDGELINDESIAKAAAALKDFAGISTMVNGELRLPSDVLDELADKWDTLSKVQQSAISEDLGGKYHSNVVAALMGNWELVEKMMTDYAEGAGSAMRENEIYMDSWEAKSKQLSSTWTEFVSHILETDAIKGVLDGAITAIELLDTESTKAVATVTALAAAFGGLGKAAMAFKATDFGSVLLGMTASVTDFKAGLSLLTEVMMKNPLFAVGGAVAGAIGIATIIDGVTTTVDEQREKVAELQAQYDELTGPSSEYADLSSRADNLTTAEKNRLAILEAQSAEIERQLKLEQDLEFEKFQREQGSGSKVYSGDDKMHSSMAGDVAKLKELTTGQESLNKAFLDGSKSEAEYREGLQGIISDQAEYYEALVKYKEQNRELTESQYEFIEAYEQMLNRLSSTETGDLGVRLAFEEFDGVFKTVDSDVGKTVVNVSKLRKSLQDAGASAEDIERTFSNMDLDDTVVTFDIEGNTEEAVGELEELGIAIRSVDGQSVTIDYNAFMEMANAIGLSRDEAMKFLGAAIQLDGVSLENVKGEVLDFQGLMDAAGATKVNPTFTADTSAATSSVQSFIDLLGTIPRKITTILSTQNNGSIPTLGTFDGKAKGDKNFAGGTVLLGDQYSPTGSPMPELVITKDSAFIAGANGPEIRTLPAGSQILPYSETKKVLARSGTPTNDFPAFASGANLWKYYYGTGSSGSSGGSAGTSSSTSKSSSGKGSSNKKTSSGKGSSSKKTSSKSSASSKGSSGASDGWKDDPNVEEFEDRVKLLESELELMEAQGRSASELAAKMREIQGALNAQANYMRSIGADQTEINKLSTEWWKVREDITKAYQEEMQDERDLLESELELMENQGKPVKDRISKLKQIQDSLHKEAEFLREIGAEQEEINKLSNEWWQIQEDIKKVQEALWSELEDAVDKELERARDARDKELEALDKRIESLSKEREEKQEQVTLEEKLLAVEEARAALQNAQNERNVRYFNAATGQWEWGADVNTVKSAQENLDSAIKDLDDYRSELEYEAAIEAIEERKNAINSAYDALEEGWERITESVQEPTRAISEILADIAQNGTPLMKAQVEQTGLLLGDLNNYISAAIAGSTGASMYGNGALKDYTKDTTDYSSLMDRAKDEAEFQYWAEQRANKMAAQGIDPNAAGYRSNEEIYAQWKGGGSSSSAGGKSKTVKVQANGKAPAGLSAGDKVETAGGTYEITGVKADGSYESKKVYDSGGILKGMGGIKATNKDEIVIPPDVTDFMLNPSADSVFKQRMSELRYMYGGVPNQAASVAGTPAGGATYDHSGDEYHYGNITLTEEQAKSMTIYDLAQKARSLGIYSNT